MAGEVRGYKNLTCKPLTERLRAKPTSLVEGVPHLVGKSRALHTVIVQERVQHLEWHKEGQWHAQGSSVTRAPALRTQCQYVYKIDRA
jgi:hypothetical protein